MKRVAPAVLELEVHVQCALAKGLLGSVEGPHEVVEGPDDLGVVHTNGEMKVGLVQVVEVKDERLPAPRACERGDSVLDQDHGAELGLRVVEALECRIFHFVHFRLLSRLTI